MSTANCSLCATEPKTDWAGKWICAPGVDAESFSNTWMLFRKRFDAPAGRLTIRIAAEKRYDLLLDGVRVNRGSASDHPAYKSFDTHELEVGAGQHVLAVTVYTIGDQVSYGMAVRPGLMVEIETADGERIGTDESFRAMRCPAHQRDLPARMSHFGHYEVCDFRKLPADWTQLDFDDGDWPTAEVIGPAGCDPWLRLLPRDIPLLATQRLDIQRVVSRGRYTPAEAEAIQGPTPADEMAACPREVTQADELCLPMQLADGEANEFVVVDFGREVTGQVRLELDGVADGQPVDIGYDEVLDDRGLPNTRRSYANFADRYILRAGQRQLEVFDGRGFRYLMIDVSAGCGSVALRGVSVDERTYPVETTGQFHCPDERLEAIYQAGLLTARLCSLDNYVDTPSRERAQWMDFYGEALVSTYGTGDTALWRRSLYLFAQTPWTGEPIDGAMKCYAPVDENTSIREYIMYYVMAVSDYVFHTGDRAVGENLLPTVERQFEALKGYCVNADGVIGPDWPNWKFLDWSAMDDEGTSCGSTALYIVMHRKAARLARQLGRQDLAETWQAAANHTTGNFRKWFFQADEGLFVDSVYDTGPGDARSQLSNVLAIWAGCADGDEAREILRKITDPADLLPPRGGDWRLRPDFVPDTGGIIPIGTPALGWFLAMVLFDLDMTDEALDYLGTRWPEMMVNGSLAEHFFFDKCTSYCHAWSACPTWLLPRYVLGIRPLEPGWKKVLVAPRTGSLEWASGSVPTPAGLLEVSWSRKDGRVQLDVNAPEGMEIVE